ncbi:MAG: PepSY domain-containing protein [Candidatus Sulfotelmatobacter sp.]
MDTDCLRTRNTAYTSEMSGTAFLQPPRQRSPSRMAIPRSAVMSAALIALLVTLVGCSSESTKPAEPAKPEVKGPELISARSGFQKLYLAARGWNADSKPYRIESIATSDGNGHDGKWAVWRANFASAAQRSEKGFTWSGSSADGAPSRGINPGTEDTYSATNASTQVFDMAFLKVDSDQAAETANKHGGDKVLEKSPDTPLTFVCDWNHNTNQLVWHVIYGARSEGAKLTVLVNASTGEFIRVEK